MLLVRDQLQQLQTSYIDLYMLHSPFDNKELQVRLSIQSYLLSSNSILYTI